MLTALCHLAMLPFRFFVFLVAQIQCHNYQSVNQSMDISDHSPVFCTFNVLVSGQGHVPQPVWVG